MNRFSLLLYGFVCLLSFNLAVGSLLPGGRDAGLSPSDLQQLVAIEGLWAGRGAAGEQRGVPIVWFRLRNNGPHPIAEVRVKVSFLDENGQVVHQSHLYPVHDGAYGPTTAMLQPGGMWQMSGIRYFIAEGVPHTWSVGKVKASVAGIRLAN